ncbi:unnamed protein product [Hymenolepis diminuta]|uniref:Uncharacterized protein n=1 Tax=Hymenolepis diminuta TaxID=6216 RepID=A0A564XZT3_HYMDI|nr:unnamed protein product [Hymenolepis diminuta]
MSKRVHRFPIFSETASLHVKGTFAFMLWCGLTQVTHMKLSLLSRQRRTLVGYGLLCCSRSPSLCYSLWLP